MAINLDFRITQAPVAGDTFTIVINDTPQVFTVVDGEGDTFQSGYNIGTNRYIGLSGVQFTSVTADNIAPALDNFVESLVPPTNMNVINYGGSPTPTYVRFFVETNFIDEITIDSFSSNKPYIQGILSGVSPVGGGEIITSFELNRPTAVVLDARTDNSISISWSQIANDIPITGYEVYRNDVLVEETNNLSFVDENLAPDTEYTYKVASRGVVGGQQARSPFTDSIALSTLALGEGEQQIIVEEEIDKFYPVHNNSFLKYRYFLRNVGAVTGTTLRSSITIRRIGGVNVEGGFFVIFADLEEEFFFNFKEPVKYLIFENFALDTSSNIDGFTRSLDNVIKVAEVNIQVYSVGSNGTEGFRESIDRNLTFKNSLVQVGGRIFSNPYQLLFNSEDGVNYYKTYFEGFPFNIDIQNDGETSIRILNKSTGSDSDLIDSIKGPRRFVVDSSNGSNWNSNGYLVLKNEENNLVIEVDGKEVTNLVLDKKKISKGVYLKWWNGDGSHSFWLFERFYREEMRVRNNGDYSRENFRNVPNREAISLTTGKNATKRLRIRTKVSRREFQQIESLFISPKVQIYSSQNANVKGEFLDVQLNQNYEYYNKKNINSLDFTITLPEVVTAKI